MSNDMSSVPSEGIQSSQAESVSSAPESTSSQSSFQSQPASVSERMAGSSSQSAASGQQPKQYVNPEAQQHPMGHSPASAAQAQQQIRTARQVAQSMGYDPSSYTSDTEMLRDLVNRANQAQQLQQMAQYGQQYVQHASEFNAWMRQRQEEAAAKEAAAAKETWWKAPEFDPEWRSKIVRDSNGNLTVMPGASPDIISKYANAVEHRDKFLEKFAFDPIGAIQPGIEEIAGRMIQQAIEQRFSVVEDQNFAKEYISKNTSWLHKRDAAGNTVIDRNTGKPALTPYGKAFVHYVSQAANYGIGNENDRANYATAMVQRDYMRHQMERQRKNMQMAAQQQAQQQAAMQAQQQAVTQGQQQKQAFVSKPSRETGVLSRVGNADAAALSGTGAKTVRNKSLNLAERMRQSLEANGIAEGDIKRARAR